MWELMRIGIEMQHRMIEVHEQGLRLTRQMVDASERRLDLAEVMRDANRVQEALIDHWYEMWSGRI